MAPNSNWSTSYITHVVKYIDVIKDMYEGVVTSVKTVVGNPKKFSIAVGSHRGSALSPYLFTLVMNELTNVTQDEVPGCMIYADDIVLNYETSEGVNKKLELWRNILDSKGSEIYKGKTKYMH